MDVCLNYQVCLNFIATLRLFEFFNHLCDVKQFNLKTDAIQVLISWFDGGKKRHACEWSVR